MFIWFPIIFFIFRAPSYEGQGRWRRSLKGNSLKWELKVLALFQRPKSIKGWPAPSNKVFPAKNPSDSESAFRDTPFFQNGQTISVSGLEVTPKAPGRRAQNHINSPRSIEMISLKTAGMFSLGCPISLVLPGIICLFRFPRLSQGYDSKTLDVLEQIKKSCVSQFSKYIICNVSGMAWGSKWSLQGTLGRPSTRLVGEAEGSAGRLEL